METHSEIEDFLSTMYLNYSYTIISKPTRVNDKTATLIDNIFTSSLNEVIYSGILGTDISDNGFSKHNISIFKKELGEVSWSEG